MFDPVEEHAWCDHCFGSTAHEVRYKLHNSDSWDDPADDEDWTTSEEWNEGEDEGR